MPAKFSPYEAQCRFRTKKGFIVVVKDSQAKSCIFATVPRSLLPFLPLFLERKIEVIVLEIFVQDEFITFRELLLYFEYRLVFTVRHVSSCLFSALCNHKRRIQICRETSSRFSGNTSSKTKIDAESTLRNFLPQLTALYFAARQVGHKSGNTRNRVFQIAMQLCCETGLYAVKMKQLTQNATLTRNVTDNF